MWFVEFWTNMPWVVILLICLTAIFAIGEILTPGFGVCGTLSGICTVCALIAEGVMTKNLFNILMLFILFVVIAGALFGLFLVLSKTGLIKSAIIENRTTLPYNYNQPDVNIKLGKIGEVVSLCKPVGKARFNKKIYTVISKNGNLDIGRIVAVVEIKNNQIYVAELSGGRDE